VADPGRRLHALRDKVFRRDVLWRAWVAVRRNNGAPGIDKTTLDQVEEYGVARLLDELAVELKEGRYRPLPTRRVLSPKPGSTEKRPLSIPSARGPQSRPGHGTPPVSSVVPADAESHHRGLDIKQFSLGHVARASRNLILDASGRPPLP
jgi:hypothetical protein